MKRERINGIIKRIAFARTRKGFSYENMSQELSITPAAYRKIEIGETRLTVERLFRISEILDEPLPVLLEDRNEVFQQSNNGYTTDYQLKIFNSYQENKEVFQNYILNLKGEISHLKSEITFLRNLVGKK